MPQDKIKSKKAIVLLSGGLDSTTVMAIAKEEGYEIFPISFDYGQRHNIELEAAKRVANHFKARDHKIIKIPDLGAFKGSALTDLTIDVPDYKDSKEIPTTYVPARNTIFLSFALGYAEVLNSTDIFIGASEVDYSGYPDCRTEFFKAFEQMANLATKAQVAGNKIKIHTPLINLSKAQTISKGMSLGVDYSITVSCYAADVNGHACGKCDSCFYRAKGFLTSGYDDQTIYQK